MEEEDSEVEEGFSYHGGRWQPERAGVMEGTSCGTTRWPLAHRPDPWPWRNGRQSASEVLAPRAHGSWLESDSPWTQEIRGARGGHRSGRPENPMESKACGSKRFATWGLGTRYGKKSAIRTDGGAHDNRTGPHPIGSNAPKNFTSAPTHKDASVFPNHGPGGNRAPTRAGPDGTEAHGRSGPLSELCAGTVALCSLYYVRLKKERQLRDSERRRRVFFFRRSKARERLNFAMMWASSRLAGEETGAPPGDDWAGRESRIWNTIIDKTFSRFDWMESFRMTKSTFDFLCSQLRPVFQRADADLRRAVPVEVRLAMTLWHLGSSCDFQSMEKIFGFSCSTIRIIVRDLCETVASVLAPKLISIPRGGVLQEALKGFERRYGLAQVAGVIGSLHVAIGSTDDSTGQFYNTKGWHSVVLQAVVDHDFCFWDLNVGCPGSLSDSQVLVASELYERGTEGTLFPDTTRNVNGIEVPLHLLGSRSYPLLPWLMTPMAVESSAADVELNRRFVSALTLTQIAFGRLKSRWRCLLKRGDVDLAFLPILVTACCALHNVCECRREPFEDRWLEEASEEELEQPSEVEEDDLETEGAAEEIRTALAKGVRT